MSVKTRILIIEDSYDDRVLLKYQLKKGGLNPDCHFIETRDEFEEALKSNEWDVIISDYNLPGFDGLTALNMLRDSGSDTPFILISGAVGEQLAVEMMKSGANDYLMKDNLARLVPVIDRELKEARNRLKQKEDEAQRQRLETIVRQSINEVYIFNSTTLRFEYANKSALKNLGYTHEEISSLTPFFLKKEYNSESFSTLLEPLLNGSKEQILFHTTHQRKDGSEYPVEVQLQIIREEKETFYAAIVLDLSSRKRDENIIQKQKELASKLVQISKHKSEFIANVSHELRTPLNSILLLSNLLGKKLKLDSEDKKAEYADEIHNSAVGLMELINEILDISKIEAGEMSFKISEVSVEAIIDSQIKCFKHVAEDKGLTLDVGHSTSTGTIIKTDSLRLQQILKNLLSNAIKFTDEGTVNLTVYHPEPGEIAAFLPKEQNGISFTVTDTGIGIGEKDHLQVFEAFHQVDGSAERRFSGTGLGLTISKDIANTLGGTIKLQSEPGKGSSFTLYLPADSTPYVEAKMAREKNEALSPEIPEIMREYASLSRKNARRIQRDDGRFQILLVDDSEVHGEALKELLDDDRKVCTMAHTAKQAYSTIEQGQIDLVILDLGLPDADGFDVVKHIRSSYSKSELPIIIYSGRSMPDGLDTKTDDMLNAFITKSSGSFQKVMQTVDFFVNRANSHQEELITPPENGSTKTKTILIADDDKRNIFSLQKALEGYNVKIATAGNGREAFDYVMSGKPADLILMDMMMPVMSGYEATEKIRSLEKWKSLPIVAVTARAMPEDRVKCFEAGVSDYISKPIDLDILIKTISRWIKLSEK
ncbi:MAG: response regulator [Balneolia bacterium]|nr:response regulator [Balneolia bacterium]